MEVVIRKVKKTRKKKSPAQARKRVKRSPVRKKGVMVPITLESQIPLDLEPDPTDFGYLRTAAEQYYIMSVNQCSLADLNRHSLFKVVQRRSLEKWCSEDSWVAKRRKMWTRIHQSLEQQIGTKIAKERMGQLEKLQKVYDVGINKLLKGGLKSKSFEGLVTAMVKLASLMDDWRENLAKQFGGIVESTVGLNEETSPRAPAPELSTQEARSIVKLLFQMRRIQAEEGGA
jgi:hypothetical protein